MSNWIDDIERLKALKESGHISEVEFEEAKSRILSTTELSYPWDDANSSADNLGNATNDDSEQQVTESDAESRGLRRTPKWVWVLAGASLLVTGVSLFANLNNGGPERSPMDLPRGTSALQKFGNFYAVPENWIEKYDPIYGPKKLLGYLSDSQTTIHSLVASCEDGHFVFMVRQGDGGKFPIAQFVNVAVNLDDGVAEKQRWIVNAGSSDISPGTGGPADALRFLDSLAGHSKLAIKSEDWGDGTAVDEPAEVFDISGVDAVIANLKTDCGR